MPIGRCTLVSEISDTYDNTFPCSPELDLCTFRGRLCFAGNLVQGKILVRQNQYVGVYLYGGQHRPFHSARFSGLTIMELPSNVAIVACKVFAPELAALGIEESQQVIYLDQGLHRYPGDLREKLVETLSYLEKNETLEKVILCYGYCGGGLDGLISRRLELILPLAHDCIPLLLGVLSGNPCVGCGDTFYLSPGWIDYDLTPYTEYFVTAEKYGHEDALWLGREMLKGYREVVLVETTAPLQNHHRLYAQKMAQLFDLTYRETLGNREWLARLLTAQTDNDVSVLPPGNPINLKLYPMPEAISRPDSRLVKTCQTK